MSKKFEDDDSRVKVIFGQECACEHSDTEITVTPGWMTDNGNPICSECGEEYWYLRTEVIDK